MSAGPHPASPLLDHCPASLPALTYFDPEWFAREQRLIWQRTWVFVARLADLAPATMTPVEIGGAGVILCRLADGGLRAFLNVCRHRGAELCATTQPLGGLIRCPYHAFAYGSDDGRLVSCGHATPTADFDKTEYGLFPVATHVWGGLVFVCLADDPPAFAPDPGGDTLANWPLADLVAGHRHSVDIACNWKVFWENYNECLHCPGIHPGLSDLVPVYRQGVMSDSEVAGWTPDMVATPDLRDGAQSWTPSGAPCGPPFPDLTAAERTAGHHFVTLYPGLYVVAHVDHVRLVQVTALDPETTRLTATWLFSAQTLAQPGFDARQIAGFAMQVMAEDGVAAEMNQRGLHAPRFSAGRLMPQEFDIARFHAWALNLLG